MKKRNLMTALAGATLVAGLAFGLVGPSAAASAVTAANATSPIEEVAPTKVPTWEEFKSGVLTEPDGTFIVDGDIPIYGEDNLKHYYDDMVGHLTGTLKDDHNHGEHGDLVIMTKWDGSWDKWSGSAARDLTYCVSNSFGSYKQAAIDSMEAGAAPWEAASSGVDFRYVPAYDGNCYAGNPNVTFVVIPYGPGAGNTLASAFFPSYPKERHHVKIATSAFTTSWGIDSVMQHELGHVLGFRHEHIVPEAGARYIEDCSEDSNWEQVTPYDSVSIMHYPQCNGDNRGLSFSSYDRQGTRIVYGW